MSEPSPHTTSHPTMWGLLTTRPHYRRLVLGNTISQLGDWLSYVAVSLLSVSSGEGGVALAFTFIAHSLPNTLTAPWAGRVADRFDRRKVLISAYAASALLTVLMCVAAHEGAVWWLQALLFVRAGLSAFGNTARQAATPSVVTRGELYTANALVSLIWSTLFTTGVALGGVLTALLGPTEAIAIDALTFFASIAAVWGLPKLTPNSPPLYEAREREVAELAEREVPQASQAEQAEQAKEAEQAEQAQDEERRLGLWGSWRRARQDPQLAAALLAKTPAAAINGAGWIALTMLSTSAFGDKDGLMLGLFHATRGVGTGVGPIVLKRVWPKSANMPTTLGLVSILGLIWAPTLWVALPCLVLWGMGLGHNYVRSTATIQLHTPSSILGRLTAFDLSCFTLAQSCAALFTGWLFDQGLGWELGVYVMSGVTLLALWWLRGLERAPRRSVGSQG